MNNIPRMGLISIGATKPIGNRCVVFWISVMVFSLFAILGRGAAYIGYPPVYAGEVTALLFGLHFFNWRILRRFIGTGFGLLVLFYAIIPALYMMINGVSVSVIDFGLAASAFYYGIFIYYGYAAIKGTWHASKFIEIIYWVIILNSVHNMANWFLPLKDVCPVINGVPLLGHTDGRGCHVLVGLPYLLLFADKLKTWKAFVLLILFLFSFLNCTTRSLQIGIILTLLLLIYYRHLWTLPQAKKMVLRWVYVMIAVLILSCVFAGDWIKDKIQSHAALMQVSFGGSDRFSEKSGSQAHRIEMWSQIFNETCEHNPFLGQGFNQQLIDVKFRSPHNGFVTVFGRSGFFGLSLAIAIYLGIPLYALTKLRRWRNNSQQKEHLFLISYVLLFLLMVMTGPTLESPFSALVLNFLLGVLIRYTELSTQGIPCSTSA